MFLSLSQMEYKIFGFITVIMPVLIIWSWCVASDWG
jgi:hypothetical protein